MVDFAGGRGVEQAGVGSHLPQHGPTTADLGVDLLGDGPTRMAVGQDGADDSEPGVDSFPQDLDRFI